MKARTEEMEIWVLWCLRNLVILGTRYIENFQGKLQGIMFVKEWDTFYVFKKHWKQSNEKAGQGVRQMEQYPEAWYLLKRLNIPSLEPEEGREKVRVGL